MEESDNVGIVTLNSLEKAIQYSREKNYGRAFSHYLVVFQLLSPQARKEHEKEFVDVLHIWGSTLYKMGQYENVFRCYNLALSYFPDNVEILNNLGVHALKLNCLKQAKHYFETAHALDPHFLPAEQNLQTSKIALVERWHFPMLNDTTRNKAFARAIFLGISRGFTKVLDVGTGTGILSLFASKSKQIKSITACDYSETMYEIATNVIQTNNITNIKLVNKKSTKLKVPKDMKERATLLVTEILDSGVFGEDILQTLIHAWDHLLCPHPYGMVIPSSVSIYIMGIESSEIIRKVRFIPKNILNLDKFCMYYDTGLYDTENLNATKFTPVTNKQMCLHVDFNNILQLKTVVKSHRNNPKIQLRCQQNGTIDCFVMWFQLTLIDGVSLSNDPLNQTCWEQAIVPLKHPLIVRENESIDIQVSCTDGKLNIPNLSKWMQSDHKCYKLTKEQIYFLNDSTFMAALQELKNYLVNRFPSPKYIHVLDLSPFPILGFLLAQHGCKLSVLATDTQVTEKLCAEICNGNGIENENIRYVTVDELNRYPDIDEGFDVVFQNLISTNGLLNETELYQALLMRHSVNSSGVYVPQRVEIWAQIVECNWIDGATIVDDKNLYGFKIAQFINEYKTTEQQDMNFGSVHHIGLSKAEKMGEIEWNIMDPAVSTVSIKITKNGRANAIFYWFDIQLYKDLNVSTRRNDSYVNNAAFVLDAPIDLKVGDFKTMVLKQHKGIIKIFFDDEN